MMTTPTSSSHSNSNAVNGRDAKDQQHIWLVTGPAGCGKSTVAEHLADSLSMPYIEGDLVSFYSFSFNMTEATPTGCDVTSMGHH